MMHISKSYPGDGWGKSIFLPLFAIYQIIRFGMVSETRIEWLRRLQKIKLNKDELGNAFCANSKVESANFFSCTFMDNQYEGLSASGKGR